MIRKLRVRFIILSTASLLLLLGIIVISSSVLTYRELVENADRVLAMLAENGVHPLPELPPEQVRFPGTDAEKRDKAFMGPFGRRPLSPESMYEARFFAVVLSAEGQVLRVDTQRIVMVDETEAGDYGEAAYRKKGARGFIGEFRYQKLTGENSDSDHEMCVLFLDCGRNLFTFKHSLMINCLISFLGLVAVFIVIVVISGKIVRPVSESYEKQKQFISVAGHEIRTPVTIIDADAELLAMEIGDGNEWLQDICKQTKRMAVLTDNLLTLSRMDEHRQQYTMIDFPISDVVEETVLSFQALAHDFIDHNSGCDRSNTSGSRRTEAARTYC